MNFLSSCLLVKKQHRIRTFISVSLEPYELRCRGTSGDDPSPTLTIHSQSLPLKYSADCKRSTWKLFSHKSKYIANNGQINSSAILLKQFLIRFFFSFPNTDYHKQFISRRAKLINWKLKSMLENCIFNILVSIKYSVEPSR